MDVLLQQVASLSPEPACPFLSIYSRQGLQLKSPNEFQIVKKVLDQLKVRMNNEFANQRETCSKQIAQLESNVRLRNENIARNEDTVKILLEDLEKRNRERRADLALLGQVSTCFLVLYQFLAVCSAERFPVQTI